jgi:hypothetical protein
MCWAASVTGSTGCDQTHDYAFAGQSSFTALGISTGSTTDENAGYVWVTANAVDRDFLSRPPGSAPHQPARLARALYPDGSAAIVDVPDDRQPPADH